MDSHNRMGVQAGVVVAAGKMASEAILGTMASMEILGAMVLMEMQGVMALVAILGTMDLEEILVRTALEVEEGEEGEGEGDSVVAAVGIEMVADLEVALGDLGVEAVEVEAVLEVGLVEVVVVVIVAHLTLLQLRCWTIIWVSIIMEFKFTNYVKRVYSQKKWAIIWLFLEKHNYFH